MSPVPFDTHAVVQQLEGLGFPQVQAEGLMTVLAGVVTSVETAAATKADLTAATQRLDSRLDAIQGEFTHLKWGLGLGFSFVMALLLLQANWLWQLMQRVH